MRCFKGKIGQSTVEDAQFKVSPAEDSGPGWLEGYLAVFNNVDRAGERILPGAFSKTAAERVASGKIPLMSKHFAHGGDVVDMIGKISQAKETDHGLWIHADFLGDEDSQKVRAKTLSGAVRGLSVGYRVIQYAPVVEGKDTIYNLKELELLEGTVTVRPCNELAGITASKTMDDDAVRGEFEDELARALNVPRLTVSAALDRVLGKAGAPDTGDTTSLKTAVLRDMELANQHHKIILERLKA